MNAQVTLLIEPLRDAAWLTSRRAIVYCRILAAALGALSAVWVLLSRNGIDPAGRPLGTDFLSFWAASKLALSGSPEAAYAIDAHYAAQQMAFPGAEIEYAAFFYPPVFLLICLPLALMPYLVALAIWLIATGYAYWRVVRGFLGPSAGALALIAFPAVLINVGHGQNGFLSAALLGGGVLALQKRPVLAGLLFGCLAFKPHLAMLLPVALAARGAWKAFFVTGATAMALSAASFALFGAATWRGFLAGLPLARQTLEEELVGSEKMQSVFAAVQLLQGSVVFAYAAQGATALLVCGLLVVLARAKAPPVAQGVALVCATLLATPFLLDYDLVLMAIPIAWLYAEAHRTGFLPWEKFVLLAAFLLPLLSRLIAVYLSLPLAPIVLTALFAAVLRRGLAQSVWESTGHSPESPPLQIRSMTLRSPSAR